jgi:hypothetical protein
MGGGHRRSLAAAACLLWLSAPSTGHAGEEPQSATASEQDKEKARELYLVGLEAQQQQDWQGAYDAFAEAWQLNQHYQIAGNLGSVEIELGRHRQAAEHLDFALREMRAAGESDPAAVRALEQLLGEARRQVATVRPEARWIDAALAGVELWVDGQPRPAAETLYLPPGPHAVQARTAGAESPVAQIDAQAGRTHDVSLAIHLTSTPATTPIPVPGAAAEGPSPGAVADEPGRPLWPAVLGGSLAFAGAALGVGGAVAAASKRSDADDRAAEIEASTGLAAPVACTSPSGSGLGLCDEWQSADDGAGTWLGVATAGFVVAGGATAATLLYLLWPDGDGAEPSALEAQVGLGAISLGGRF